MAVFDPGGIIIFDDLQFCARGLSCPRFVLRKETFNHCGRPKAWNSTTSWKVRVPDCVFCEKMSKHDTDMLLFMYLFMYLYLYLFLYLCVSFSLSSFSIFFLCLSLSLCLSLLNRAQTRHRCTLVHLTACLQTRLLATTRFPTHSRWLKLCTKIESRLTVSVCCVLSSWSWWWRRERREVEKGRDKSNHPFRAPNAGVMETAARSKKRYTRCGRSESVGTQISF